MVKAGNFSTSNNKTIEMYCVSIAIQSRRDAWTERAICNLNKTIKQLYAFGLKKAT